MSDPDDDRYNNSQTQQQNAAHPHSPFQARMLIEGAEARQFVTESGVITPYRGTGALGSASNRGREKLSDFVRPPRRTTMEMRSPRAVSLTAVQDDRRNWRPGLPQLDVEGVGSASDGSGAR